ncbi:uncharacterized protein [Aegilops tauschii subsp. strangulata]|nr:uncharacterized protein LOC109739475 isoform X1 [Aegilops tauschii subsp. strangulata]
MKRKGGPHSKECEKPAKMVKTNQICNPTRQSTKMARLERRIKLQAKKMRQTSIINGEVPGRATILEEQLLIHVKDKAKEARLYRKRKIQSKRVAEPATENEVMIDEAGKTTRTKSNKRCTTSKSRRNKKTPDINLNRTSERTDMEIWNFGEPSCKCERCGAIFWYEERTSGRARRMPSFGLCCQQGKVDLPPFREPPAYLTKLLRKDNRKRSKNYMQNIRLYNSMFAFTTMGGKVDTEINNGGGPYVFRMNGQNYHRIGNLLPEGEDKPRWAQLYIYDTENEVKNRINASTSEDKRESIDPHIVEGLKNMLDRDNILAKKFRMARDRFEEGDYHNVRLKLINKRRTDGRRNDMPSATEVAALIVNDTAENRKGRDIIVQYRDTKPRRISQKHPKFMAMQYPLLFPYGEDGYRENIPYILKEGAKCKRKHVTMLEYYAYRIQQRTNQSMHLLMCEKLTLQFIVDALACILQYRLDWIKTHQGNLRTELYAGLQDTIDRGDTRADQVGKRILLPSTFTDSPRYKAQNFQDAMAICRWAGYPDLFVTFTCNTAWPEIQAMLQEVGQTAYERPDIVDRVFHIKLKEFMRDIRERGYFGKTLAIIYTIEFQKRGLPHAHIVIFLDKKEKSPCMTLCRDPRQGH